jgi:hypothetical protein
MLESHVLESKRGQIRQSNRFGRARLHGHLQNAFEDAERGLGLAIDVDDVTQFLQGAEDEKRINEEREELADSDRACVDQVQHQSHDAGPEKVHGSSLDEAETPDVSHFLELEVQDLVRRAVQAPDLLRSQPEALDQLDISE